MTDEDTLDRPIVPEEGEDARAPKRADTVTVKLNPDAPPGPPPRQQTQDVEEQIESDPILGALDMPDATIPLDNFYSLEDQERPAEPEEAEETYGTMIAKEGFYQDFEPYGRQGAELPPETYEKTNAALSMLEPLLDTGTHIYHVGEKAGGALDWFYQDFEVHVSQREHILDRLKEFYKEHDIDPVELAVNVLDLATLLPTLPPHAAQVLRMSRFGLHWLQKRGFFKKNPGVYKDFQDATNPGTGEVAVPTRQDENGVWQPKTFVSQEQQEININSSMNGRHPYGDKYEQQVVDGVEPAMKLQREYNGINETIEELSKPRAPNISPWEKSNNQKSEPDAKPPKKLDLFDMIDKDADNFSVSDISRFFKIERKEVPSDVEGGEPTYKVGFDQNMPITSEEELANVVIDAHSYYMSKALEKNPKQGDIDYLMAQLSTIVERQQGGINDDYKLLSEGIENGDELVIEFTRLQSNDHTRDKLNEDMINYREGHKPFPVADYSRDMFTYAQNSKKLFKRSGGRYQERGVRLNIIDNYSPHAKDMRLLGNMTPEQFSELERPIRDWEAMGLGHLTEAEQDARLRGEWEYLQETLGSFSYGGFSPRAGFLKDRKVKYKPGGWVTANRAYGKYAYVRGHDTDYIAGSNSSLAMYDIFTQDVKKVWQKLRFKLNPNRQDSGREKAIEKLDSFADNIFNKNPAMDFENGSYWPLIGALTGSWKALATKNSTIYSIVQDAYYNALGKAGITQGLKESSGGREPSSKLLGFFQDPEFKDQMELQKIIRGRLHAIDLERTRAQPGSGSLSKASKAGQLALKDLARNIRVWSGQDYFSDLRNTEANFTYQSAVSHHAEDRATWNSMNRNFRAYLREAGLTAKEWDMFVYEIYPRYKRAKFIWSDMPDPISKQTNNYVEFTTIMGSDNPAYRNIGQKLQRAQLSYTHATVIEAKPHTVYQHLDSGWRQYVAKNPLFEGLTRFRGYKMELKNQMAKEQRRRQYYGAGGSTNYWAIWGQYWGREFAATLLVELMREAAMGKMPDIDNPEKFLKLILRAAARAIPVPWWDDFAVAAVDLLFLSMDDKERSLSWYTKRKLAEEFLPILLTAGPKKAMELWDIFGAETSAKRFDAFEKALIPNMWVLGIPQRWFANEVHNMLSPNPKYHWDEQEEKAQKKGFTYFAPPLFPGINLQKNRQ